MAAFTIRGWLEHGNWQDFAIDGLDWVFENTERRLAGTNIDGEVEWMLESQMRRLAIAKKNGEDMAEYNFLIDQLEDDRVFLEKTEPEGMAKLLHFVKM